VVVYFVDIGGIGHHRYLNFLSISFLIWWYLNSRQWID